MTNIFIKSCFLLLLCANFSSCDLVNSVLSENIEEPKDDPKTNQNVEEPKTNLAAMLPTQNMGDRMLKHDYYTVSYVSKNKNPEWAIYEMTSRTVSLEASRRRDHFAPDPSMLEGTATDADYSNSGYDRGHLVPAEDMDFSTKAMEQSFYLTNISPQEPDFNRGIWKKLENKVRKWATEYKKIYVVTGPILRKRLDNKYTIGEKVEVPKQFYKIVLDYTTPDKKGIAFLMNNEKSDKALQEFACSIRKIEEITGINFFENLSAKESEALEANFDISKWSWD